MAQQIKLIFDLLKDKRVHPLVKLFPFLSLIYLIFPDLVPGPVDDAVVIALFLQFFYALIPSHIIEEHKKNEDNVIEGEFWEE